jgi:hypothetical protein
MNEITASKAEFSLDLANAGLDVIDYVPGRITPPIIIIDNAPNYVTSSTLGGEYQLNLELVCIAATADNETATEQLDGLIASALQALEGIAYAAFTGVNQPYTLTTNNADYLAANIAVSLVITL